MVALICWCLTMSLPVVGSESGFILSQRSGVCGKAEIYVSSKGLKLVQKSTSCVLIMKAPDWKVNYFNMDSKVLYETDAKKWQGKSPGYIADLMSDSRFLALAPQKTANAKSIAGLHCNETQLVHIGILPPNTKLNENELKSATYYGTSALSVPDQAVLVVQRFYRIPTIKGFPVKVDVSDLQGHNQNELNTSSCVKSVFSSSIFDVPTGYKKVTAEEAVTAGDQGLLQDMSTDLGGKFGTP